MESKPAHTIKIHEHLRSKLCDLYENDCIFDKYEVAVGNTNQQFMTGSYNNTFHLYNTEKSSTTRVEAGKDPSVDGSEVRLDGIDFGKKMLHTSWHPKQNALAIAGLNNLFIYST